MTLLIDTYAGNYNLAYSLAEGSARFTVYDFNARLHRNGGDIKYFANTFELSSVHQLDNKESYCLGFILLRLFQEDFGVEAVEATPFSLKISHTSLVAAGDLGKRIRRAIEAYRAYMADQKGDKEFRAPMTASS
jgi:hypothetical protein